MEYNLTGFSNKDAKLIRDNPGKEPAELVDLGLSNKAFEKISKQIEDAGKAPVQQVATATPPKSEVTPKATPIQPTIIEPSAKTLTGKKANTKQVNVKGPTGKVSPMAYNIAMRLVTNSPTQYSIVE